MIEAPEAAVLERQLCDTVKGKRISLVLAAHTPHKFTFYHGDPASYESILKGRVIDGARACGGMVHIEAGPARLVFSDGANLTYYPPGARLPAKHQLLVGFDDESCLVVSVRMYGAVWCYLEGHREERLADYETISCQKPQVLSPAFSEDYFMGLISADGMSGKSAKAALATEQSIPGLGNGVLQDILYNARINPKTKIKDLSEGQLRGLYGAIVSTLREMVSKGGRSTESDLFGKAGGYVPWLSKDTLESPCPRCGSPIVKENYMGGSIYYCTGCQKPIR